MDVVMTLGLSEEGMVEAWKLAMARKCGVKLTVGERSIWWPTARALFEDKGQYGGWAGLVARFGGRFL